MIPHAFFRFNSKIVFVPVMIGMATVMILGIGLTVLDDGGVAFLQAAQGVISADNTSPTITAPPDVVLEATGRLSTVDIGTANATDNRDSNLTIINNATGPFPIGTTIVQWSTQDSRGNTATALQTVTMRDSVAPYFTAVPVKIQMTFATGSSFVIDFATLKASDDVDNTVAVYCTPSSHSVFSAGSTTVTCTAFDDACNAAETSFEIVVDVLMNSPPPTFPDSFETITDSFDGHGSWMLFTSIGEYHSYVPYNDYTFSIDYNSGNPSPSARISGEGFVAVAEIRQDVDLRGLDDGDDLFLSIDYRATSSTAHDRPTNASVKIYDSGGNMIYKYWPANGGVTDTKWQRSSLNITDVISGHDGISIGLGLRDNWIAKWNQNAYFDNFYLGTAPADSNDDSGVIHAEPIMPPDSATHHVTQEKCLAPDDADLQ